MSHYQRWTGVLLATTLFVAVRPSAAVPPATPRGHQEAAVEPVWHLAGEGRGRPLLDAGAVYFLTKHHELLAVDAASGTARWRTLTGEPGEATMGTSVAGTGSVVVAGDYNLVAFAKDSGAVRWRFVPEKGYAPGVYLGAAADGVVFAGSPAGRLYAVDAESGGQRWSTPVVPDSATDTTVFQPIVDRDRVVVMFTTFTAPNVGGVASFDRHSGARKWRTDFPPGEGGDSSGAAGGPLAIEQLIVAASASGTIYAFDRDSGRIQWSIPGIRKGEQDFRPLVSVGRTLVAGSLTGCVLSYDLSTRAQRWRYCDPAGASVAFAIGSDGRTVYAPYYEGRLVAIDGDTGKEMWRMGGGPDAGFNWVPAADGDRVYVAATIAGFFALRRR
jgi:outer membrane protein assembly factor BamB